MSSIRLISRSFSCIDKFLNNNSSGSKTIGRKKGEEIVKLLKKDPLAELSADDRTFKVPGRNGTTLTA